MTHSLHRFGPYQEVDFVWQVHHAKGINDQNVPEKLQKVMEVVKELGSENWGDVKTGSVVCTSEEVIRARLTVQSRLRGVFTGRDQVVRFLKRMKELDLGLSVIIGGSSLRSLPPAKRQPSPLIPLNYSLGVFGRTELLPDEEVLGGTSMCGHHMIAGSLVERLRERVRKGNLSPGEAAKRLSCLCPCGIFDPVRAKIIIAGTNAEGGEILTQKQS